MSGIQKMIVVMWAVLMVGTLMFPWTYYGRMMPFWEIRNPKVVMAFATAFQGIAVSVVAAALMLLTPRQQERTGKETGIWERFELWLSQFNSDNKIQRVKDWIDAKDILEPKEPEKKP